MAALRRAGGDGLRWATGRGSRGVANPLKVPTVNHHLKLLNQGYVDSSVSNRLLKNSLRGHLNPLWSA
jgi:hypothetical protein